MNRIAVILRGHLRTWNYIKPAVFDFWRKVSLHVDYYFVTWDVPGLDTYQLREDFKHENLIKILPVEIPQSHSPKIYSSWKGPGWLSYNILPYKRLREKQVKYDAVFDTRPDILYRLTGKSILKPEPMTLYTNSIMSSGSDESYYVGLADIFFAMPSNVYDIIAERFIIDSDPARGSHYDFIKLCEREKISPCKLDWAEAVITRPTAIGKIPDPLEYFTSKKHSNYMKFITNWAQASVENKKRLLDKYKINYADFENSDSPLAKL